MIYTVYDIKQQKIWLQVRCEDCRRTVHIPFKLLPKILPDDLPVHLAAAHFRCDHCKGKNISSKEWRQQDASGYAS